MVVSLREKGVDLNGMGLFNPQLADVSLREKGVDLNDVMFPEKGSPAGLPS